MPTILKIDNDFCRDLMQLRDNIRSMTYGSEVYTDVLDYVLCGDMEVWLREHGYEDLGNEVAAIDKSIGDSEIVNQLTTLLLEETSNIKKPKYTNSFSCGISVPFKSKEKVIVLLSITPKSCINENYEIQIKCEWEQEPITYVFNPGQYEENHTHNETVTLHRKTSKETGKIVVSIEGEQIFEDSLNNNEEIHVDDQIKPDVEMGELKVKADGKELTRIQTKRDPEEIPLGGMSFKMIHVEGGTFQMGATPEMKDPYDWEKSAHEVTLSSFLIGETPVTQALWEAVMGNNPSYIKGRNNPVANVSWCECQEFIKKLNTKTGKRFRLPTEAEWEFAARGGVKSKHTQYSGSEYIDDVAWYGGNSGSKTHPVKTKKPNELGIYDMSGNVWEWCEDYYEDYSSSPQTNPIGPTNGYYRVSRGGSWHDGAIHCCLSYRYRNSPDNAYFNLGFRLALSEL